MSEPFLGEIRQFGFNFAPRGWALCNGQLMSIAQNTALFSLLGTQYGGDGQTTFALPDLRGRVSLHQGQGPGLSNYVIGETAGEESHTLTSTEMPVHTHTGTAAAASGAQTTNRATGAAPATGGVYGVADAAGAAVSLATAGGSQPHNTMQPYLVTNWCIALQGIFPSRN